MRIRTIKPELPQSESIGRVSRDARLLFIQLWPICDDSGRTRGASRMLASLLFPYDDDAPALVDNWMQELEREKMIVRYVVNGDTYLQICNWAKHQKIDKPSPSKIPPFDESSRILANPRECSSGDRDQGSGTKDQGSNNPLTPLAGGKAQASQESPQADELALSDNPPAKAKSAPIKCPLQLRAEKLHGKRPETPWDRAELNAWKTAKAVVEATSEEEWQLLEWFYPFPQNETFRRKELAQTLNNWSGEITKARAFKANGKKYPGAMR